MIQDIMYRIQIPLIQTIYETGSLPHDTEYMIQDTK